MSHYHVVTGAAGFIGSNVVRALNQRGIANILAVDNLAHADKFANLVGAEIADYLDKRDFLERLLAGEFEGALDAILHQGACSDTMATDGRYMMDNNFRYSVALLDSCLEEEVPLIYASSASVYGAGRVFRESPECEAPLNIYGYSKYLFDQIVRRRMADASSQVVGLRYFNVYGRNESHKGRMASVAWHFCNEYRTARKVKLFEGSDGYAAGEQRRDFIAVEDVVGVLLHFLERPQFSGIYNVGTGRAQSFNEVAETVINTRREATGESKLSRAELTAQGAIEYVPFPSELKGRYQSFTEADLAALRGTGYDAAFLSVADGVGGYVRELLQREGARTR